MPNASPSDCRRKPKQQYSSFSASTSIREGGNHIICEYATVALQNATSVAIGCAFSLRLKFKDAAGFAVKGSRVQARRVSRLNRPHYHPMPD